MQRIESPECLPSGELLCPPEHRSGRVDELPVLPIAPEAPYERGMVRVGQVPGVPAPAEGGQGLDRQDGGREQTVTAEKDAGVCCASLFHIALHQDAGVEVRPEAGH